MAFANANIFRLVVLGLLAPCALAVSAAEPAVTLTAAQRGHAQITLLRVGPDASAAGGGGLRLAGQVVLPNEAVELSLAGVDGRLTQVRVQVGQRLAAGEVLGELYSTALLSAQRAWLEARGRQDIAASRLARVEELLVAGVVAESRVQEARVEAQLARAAALEQQQLLRLAGMSEGEIAALSSAAQMTPRVAVRARRAGVVLEQMADIGAAVAAGTPLFRLGSLAVLWVDVQATAAQARRVAVGDPVTLVACQGEGRVVATGAQLAAATQTVALRVEFRAPAQCLMPNQQVQVEFRPRTAAAGSLSVPRAALVQREGRDYVFVAQGEAFLPTPVTVVEERGPTIVVTGLAAGQQIASGGTAALKGAWLGLGSEGD